MKKLIFAVFVALIATAGFLGDRIVGRTLDTQLAPLLTEQLGLPVHLEPIGATVFTLQATSARLIMGDPSDPAVIADNVRVRLSWPHLVKRELRLIYASADNLMVRPSRWPRSGGPLPNDYLFLDQWIPRNLELQTGKYVHSDDNEYPVSDLRWQRKLLGGASADGTWEIDQKLQVTADLSSLEDLLLLAPIELKLTMAAARNPDQPIKVSTSVSPAQEAAYIFKAAVEAEGIDANITATGEQTWRLPGRSETRLERLEPDKFVALLKAYSKPDSGEDTETWLANKLPALELPAHAGKVTIDELRLGNEVGKDTVFTFETSENGIKVDSIASHGPSGILDGNLAIDSTGEGWKVRVRATMNARDDDEGLAAHFVDSQWLWNAGATRLDGEGDTWGKLLYSLAGDVSLVGHYRDEQETAVKIAAQLDQKPGVFGLEHMSVTLGDGVFEGSATLSGKEQRKLSINLTGSSMDLGFLFDDDENPLSPGIPVPEYLTILPGIDIDWSLEVTDLTAPGVSLAKAKASLIRSDEGGTFKMKATGKHYGTLDVLLVGKTPADDINNVSLSANFTRLDLPDMFQQPTLLNSRISGTLQFEAEGNNIEEIFEAMRGDADLVLEVRADNNWKRPMKQEEELKFSGNSEFVIDDKSILGVQISNLDIASVEQDLDGDVSMVAGRKPWLIADLRSDKLDITGLLELLPESTEEADQADLLRSLRQLGQAQISLDAASLIINDVALANMQFEAASEPSAFVIKQLDFSTHGSNFKSLGKIIWKKDHAILESSATLDNVDLDQFVIGSTSAKPIPVSGELKLESKGSKVAELLTNLAGHVELSASDSSANASPQSRRKLSMKATRIENGMQANINNLQWGESEMSGSITYRQSTPPLLEIDVHSGSLSLLPWEHAQEHVTEQKDAPDTRLGSAARSSAGFVRKFLLAPVRILGDEEKTAAGKRFFSSDPINFAALQRLDAKFKGNLASLRSTVISGRDMRFDGSIKNGNLAIDTTAVVGGGSADVNLHVDSRANPPSIKLTSQFSNVRGLRRRDTYPQSGFVSLSSGGNSQAELAAGVNGLAYIEAGTGPFDYVNTTLLTADLASSVFRTLIPGIENQEPTLECAITVGLFKNGIGSTPYGYAARTNQANLLGRMELDLVNERMQMSFDSRSRRGVGIAVGNVFSNTIQVRGPLTDPQVVPNTTGILWRGWAAFMTAGLSVVGESVLKRALASENPCKSIKNIIEKELCPVSPLAASSAMVCPKSH